MSNAINIVCQLSQGIEISKRIPKTSSLAVNLSGKYYNFISKYTLLHYLLWSVIPHFFKLCFKKKGSEAVKYKIFVLGKQLPKMSFQCVNIDTGHVQGT